MENAPLIRTRELAFAYEDHRRVLEGVDFELYEGESVGLVGNNGSGKTTFLHLLVGLLKPNGGTLEVLGRPRREERDFHEVRANLGLLFQDPDDQLFCPTVEEDLAFGPLNLGASLPEARERARETLALLGLEGFERRITHHLSGGEKNLVSLGTLLTMRPKVLLLDEPTASLDEPTQARITEILYNLPQAKIVVSHEPDFLEQVTTRTCRMLSGRIRTWDLGPRT